MMRHEVPALPRERKFVDVALDEVEADGSFSGYASLFGKADLAGDVVEPGAFSKALRQRGVGGIRMLYQHDPGQPIGRWTELAEDRYGLKVRGQLAGGVAKAREVLDLMRGGALDGLSIGFRTIRARRDTRSGQRRILEADLWEISVVTFPMLPDARVRSVKAAGMNELPTTREFERWLTRDARLTRGEARTVIAKGFAHLVRERDAARPSMSDLAERIRRVTRDMQEKEHRP